MALLEDKIGLCYRDISIVPAIMSDVEHRSECDPFDENGMLPLFTAPMDTVVDEHNFSKFEAEKINAILPRTAKFDVRLDYSLSGRWAAYSLSEFEDTFCDGKTLLDHNVPIKALIDVANGHMVKVINAVKKAKSVYGDDIIIMAGNIANPNTYEAYANARCDYIRLGIGGGMGCTTSSNTGVHMGMVTLIDETVRVKRRLESMTAYDSTVGGKKYNKLPYIIADGGVRNFPDIIKALALGADYVMCGGIFAKMFESASPKVCDGWPFNMKGFEIKDYERFEKSEGGWTGILPNGERVFAGDITTTFYGMASRQGQIALNGEKNKTSEGIMKRLDVEYTMAGWTRNFIDFFRSAMSYTNHKTLNDFIRYTTTMRNSENTVLSVNK